jgi:hypothetical protein
VVAALTVFVTKLVVQTWTHSVFKIFCALLFTVYGVSNVMFVSGISRFWCLLVFICAGGFLSAMIEFYAPWVSCIGSLIERISSLLLLEVAILECLF